MSCVEQTRVQDINGVWHFIEHVSYDKGACRVFMDGMQVLPDDTEEIQP